MIAVMLKVIKQRSHFPTGLRFAFQSTRNFSRAMAWCVVGLFTPCGKLPCVKVLNYKSCWKILRR